MATGPQMKPLGGLARAFASLRTKLYTPPTALIAGVDSTQNWPSALQPVQPVGPAGSQPLAFSFWQGLNQNITPRPDSPLTFQDLRSLSMYPLARICIENVKDQLAQYDWTIQIRDKNGESIADRRKRQADDKNITKLIDFFSYPDGETPWSDWIRPLIEDLMVIDAPSIIVQRTFGGDVAKLRVVDGSQILVLVNDQGFTPEGDSPAYTQLWEGIPRLLLTTKQLVYRPRNIARRNTVTSNLYGLSPVEQLAPEIRIGQERLRFILAYYTEGSVPGLVHVVPAGVSPDKIRETMEWMNSELAGNLAARRQWRMIQGFRDAQDPKEDQIVELTEPVLADKFDDVHIRKIAFGLNTSPQRLLSQVNRATSEANQDSADREGILPLLTWLKSTMDMIIQRHMGLADYEMVWDTDTELDPVKQAEVDATYVKEGIFTRNEIRDARGVAARSEKEADQLMVTTGQGAVPLEGSTERTATASQAALESAKQPKQLPAPKEDESGDTGKITKKKLQTNLHLLRY